MRQYVGLAVAIGCVALLFVGGVFVPPRIWTRDQARAAIVAGTSIGANNLAIGNSRVPCRGPSWDLELFGRKLVSLNKYSFGYTVGATHEGWASNASGSVCWSVTDGWWVWTIDPPYQRYSSDQPPETRGAGQREAGAR
jgi:hypothetical protein